MISSQILGDFNEEIFVDRKQVLLDLFIDALPVRECKKARHLSVEFLANYLAVAFLKNLEGDTRSQNPVLSEIEATATYIANELLKNSMKFSDKTSKQPIQIGLCVFEREVFLSLKIASLPVV
ncbi:MAG: hypothetical protein SVX43_12335 [Cyanobacteriota bacterium]|nr:hypothetical protein [Cyanobacteriota bacterium]